MYVLLLEPTARANPPFRPLSWLRCSTATGVQCTVASTHLSCGRV